MAFYRAPLTVNINGQANYETDVIVDLNTAKALAQVDADRQRVAEHRAKRTLVWTHAHSNEKRFWVGTIDGDIYAVLPNGETVFQRY